MISDSAPRFGNQILDLSKNPTQRAAFLDTTPYCCYSGGIGSGKTSIMCLKALYLSAKIPNNLGVVYRHTFPDLRVSTRETFCNLVPEGMVKQWKEAENRLILTNGSEILFRHFEGGKITLGPNLGWFFVDQAEELPEESFDFLMGRLRRSVPRRYGLLAMNPNGKDWQYRRFVEKKNPRFKMFDSTTLDNKDNLPPGYIEDLLDNYSQDWVDRFVFGKWTTMSGLILHEFDEDRHMTDPFPIPPDWVKVRGNDWGIDAPATCVFIAVAPDGMHYVFDAYGEKEKTAEEHADAILERSKKYGQFRASVLDSSAFGRGSDLKSVADKYRGKGYVCQPGTKDLLGSVNTFKNLLKTNRIRFFRGDETKNLIQEIRSWKWARSHANQEKPASGNDHYIDAVRYAIDFLDKKQLYFASPTTPKAERRQVGTLSIGTRSVDTTDEITGLPNG